MTAVDVLIADLKESKYSDNQQNIIVPVDHFIAALQQLAAGGGGSPAILVESGVEKKISALAAAGALAGTEPVPIVQGGATKKTTVQDIANLAGGLSIQSATVNITSPQLLNSNTTPITIVAGVPGKIIYPLNIASFFTFVTTAYASISTPGVYYDADSTFQGPVGGFNFVGAVNSQEAVNCPTAFFTNSSPNLVNSAIIYSGGGSDPTLGDGTLTITIFYITK